jgi:hypothetical protein
MPNGGITTLDPHEVMSFPNLAGTMVPNVMMLMDLTNLSAVLVAIKKIEIVGSA